ncbi:MAG: extensin family protein [Devosiaceae bacterium]
MRLVPSLLGVIAAFGASGLAAAQNLEVLPPNPVARSEISLQAPPVQTPYIASDHICLGSLAEAGAQFESLGRYEGDGRCGIDDAVSVASINGVTLQPSAVLTCTTALDLTTFLSGPMTRLSRHYFGSRPATVFVAASYACRGRNNVPGARMSEHAFGRAVDIRAITLENEATWSVQPASDQPNDAARAFQTALREAGCGPFNTVLGPGSDGHHTDHIHFDSAVRSSTYCR